MSEKHIILIVDDEPNILSSLRRVLASDELEIITAKDAEEAWLKLKDHTGVEIILSDNKLPGMPGIDFLIKAKRLYPDTIRILITGYPDLKSAMDCINKADIWRFMLKPIEIDELKMLIKQALDYHRILKENRALLKIARQHTQLFDSLKEKYPDIMKEETGESVAYAVDEKKVSTVVSDFMKKYYPEGFPEDSKAE